MCVGEWSYTNGEEKSGVIDGERTGWMNEKAGNGLKRRQWMKSGERGEEV